jgi:hypothetical protein
VLPNTIQEPQGTTNIQEHSLINNDNINNNSAGANMEEAVAVEEAAVEATAADVEATAAEEEAAEEAADEAAELLVEECSNVSGNFFGSSTPSANPVGKSAKSPSAGAANAKPPLAGAGMAGAATATDSTTPRRSTRDKIPSQKAIENQRQLAEQQAAKAAKDQKAKRKKQ